jgi:hypothetical protein
VLAIEQFSSPESLQALAETIGECPGRRDYWQRLGLLASPRAGLLVLAETIGQSPGRTIASRRAGETIAGLRVRVVTQAIGSESDYWPVPGLRDYWLRVRVRVMEAGLARPLDYSGSASPQAGLLASH